MNIITTKNEQVLRKKCIPIIKEGPSYLNNLVKSMIKLMSENKGCGLAAPQVGINKRLFVVVLDRERVEVFINPKILEYSEETEVNTEGCLSVPELCGDVERSTKIKIKYSNGHNTVIKEYEGHNARIIQHEYDHLSGILYTDKAKNMRNIQDVAQETSS